MFDVSVSPETPPTCSIYTALVHAYLRMLYCNCLTRRMMKTDEIKTQYGKMQRAQVQHTLRIALTSKSRLVRRQGDWIAFGVTAPEHPMFGVIYWREWTWLFWRVFTLNDIGCLHQRGYRQNIHNTLLELKIYMPPHANDLHLSFIYYKTRIFLAKAQNVCKWVCVVQLKRRVFMLKLKFAQSIQNIYINLTFVSG